MSAAPVAAPVAGEVGGAPVVLGYGDAAAEYRAVREAAGIAVRDDLALLRLWGRAPVKMLQGLITNDLQGAPPGRGVYAAMLTPKGRMVAELRAFRRPGEAGEEVMVALPREALAGAAAQLQKYLPPHFARWADVSGSMGVVGVYGPRAAEVLRCALGEPVPPLSEDAVHEASPGGEPVLAVGTRDTGGEAGCDLVMARGALPALHGALVAAAVAVGGRGIGFEVLEVLRIEAGRPRYGRDMDEETIATEAFEATGLMPRAISFSKGCYTGQEVIVRIAHRGHVNRQLRGLRLGELPLPAARTPLLDAATGRAVGWTTSATRSPALGEGIALGYLRREVEPGQAVRLEGEAGPLVRVVALPFSGAPAAGGTV